MANDFRALELRVVRNIRPETDPNHSQSGGSDLRPNQPLDLVRILHLVNLQPEATGIDVPEANYP
jgi:hypothetical protein